MLHSIEFIAADGFHLHYVILTLRDLKECLYSTFHDGSVICLGYWLVMDTEHGLLKVLAATSLTLTLASVGL